jgi:hypothetical protein
VDTSVERASGSEDLGFNEGSFFAGETERVGVVEAEVTKGKKKAVGSMGNRATKEDVTSAPSELGDGGGCPSNSVEPQHRGEARGSHIKQKAVREKVRVENASSCMAC